jgi:hypothetical protein
MPAIAFYEPSEAKVRSKAFSLVRLPLAGQRRVWDSNPRGRVNALVVFKTTAIGH